MASAPSREVAFSSASASAAAPGRRDTRLMTPPSADAPYSADTAPLMTSTRPRSVGGICNRPSELACPPYSGRPSASNCVKRPSSPCTRMLAAPIAGAVTCTRSPLVSLSIMATLPGRIRIFSSISSRSSTSTRSGSSPRRRFERVAWTTISGSSDDSSADGAAGGGVGATCADSAPARRANERTDMTMAS